MPIASSLLVLKGTEFNASFAKGAKADVRPLGKTVRGHMAAEIEADFAI